MGLDIYAGTLTRYYNHNWKTQAQQFAEENGWGFQTIRPDEQDGGDAATPEEVLEGMCGWRDGVVAGLSQALGEPVVSWTEDNEKAYRTNKPDWEAYGCLVLCSACYQLGERMPQTVVKGWKWYEDPVIQKAHASKECGGSLLSGVELWIPLDQAITFDYSDPCGDSARIGTIGGLLGELDAINAGMWQADRETIVSWQKSEGYPQDAQIVDGKLVPTGESCTEFDAQSLAKYAFSIFYDLAAYAQDNRLPFKMDY
ncbi:hypothetical protein [Anaerotruncus rubiinfantis]|uniref:hypothetical protein n=1 Tax=Anaerotruncus rubiinfantis TaxID=1720200 RepID=UPI00083602F0|nr:hypothetical protein [Anaerotruncus rubiinfantis]